MRMSFCGVSSALLAALALALGSGGAVAGERWYPLDDYYDYPPESYPPRPPPPPVRIYREPSPPVYEPPVYGWSYVVPPPPPASCGVYRFWNGERCADARDELPYIGPRW